MPVYWIEQSNIEKYCSVHGNEIVKSGLLTGCGQKWEIVRHYEDQLCCNQLLISKTLGVLNGVLICISVYLSNGINIIS